MSLHLYEFGPADGQPLVALHGLKSYGGRWREVAGLLPTFRVCGPDLRGQGRSPQEPPWTLEQHAVDVLGVLDAAGPDRVDVVGHSFGGAVAVALARFAPDRVRRICARGPGVRASGHLQPCRGGSARRHGVVGLGRDLVCPVWNDHRRFVGPAGTLTVR